MSYHTLMNRQSDGLLHCGCPGCNEDMDEEMAVAIEKYPDGVDYKFHCPFCGTWFYASEDDDL